MPVKLAFVLALLGGAAGDSPVVVVNGKRIEGSGMVVGGRAYVPAKEVAEAAGGEIEYVPGGDRIEITLGRKEATPLHFANGAWSIEEVRAWADDVDKWDRDCKDALALFDETELKGDGAAGAELAQSTSSDVKALKGYVDAGLRISPSLKERPYNLSLFDLAYSILGDVGAALNKYGDLSDTSSLKGTPSAELCTTFVNLSTRATNLQQRAFKHKSALYEWYVKAAGTPKY